MNISITGPSGVGKTTIINAIIKYDHRFKMVISSTTRPKREGEIDGIDYDFISMDDWLNNLDSWILTTYIDNNFYGFKKNSLLNKNFFNFLNIDENGAKELRLINPSSFAILLLPPSKNELEVRLKNRKELSQNRFNEKYNYDESWYSAVLINDEIDVCVNNMLSLIKNSM